ncbi:hypothetical protein F4818DRAFT_350856 [Hypoxylon cercidicola]|nr:hypothetical protein F4818DRAFT_350856 [Hypoxylon cercidicola]
MPALTDLPTELIQLVAGRCPALDIIALSQTCRLLKRACDNAAVFQMSFELHLPEVNSTAFKDRKALVHFMTSYVDGPKKPCQRNEGPKMTWLCLAVAVHWLPDILVELGRLASSVNVHATLNPPQMGQETKEALRGVIGFLSTLPIWGCADACDAKVAALLDYPLQFAFSLAMSSLKRRQPLKTHDLVGDPRSVFMSSTNQLLTVVRGNYDGREMGSDYDKFQGSWIGKQTHALLLMTLISRNIYHVLKATVPNRLPNPNKIEFLGPWYFVADKGKYDEHTTWTEATSLRPRFPLLTPNLIATQGAKGRYFYPFAGDEWWSWYTTRARDLARRLDEGEWNGTYTYDLQLGGRVDAPMQGIQFRRTATKGDTYSVEALDGTDGVNRFTLSGEVDASAGECRVRFRKQYPAVGYDWDGLVTPLGICGGYGFPENPRPSGYFWLWKREWMDVDEDIA